MNANRYMRDSFYIEFVLLKHLEEVEKAKGTINVDNSPKGV